MGGGGHGGEHSLPAVLSPRQRPPGQVALCGLSAACGIHGFPPCDDSVCECWPAGQAVSFHGWGQSLGGSGTCPAPSRGRGGPRAAVAGLRKDRRWPPADLASGSEIPPGLSPDSTHGRSHAPGSKSPDRSGPLHPEGRVASLWRWKEVACRSGKAPSTGRQWTSKSPQTPERCCWRRSLGRGAPAGPHPGSCASGDARSPLTPVPGVRKNQGGGVGIGAEACAQESRKPWAYSDSEPADISQGIKQVKAACRVCHHRAQSGSRGRGRWAAP